MRGVVTLSAIVPATNRPSTLAACCTALGAGVSVPEEVVVVQEPSHVNAAGARNLGASRAEGSVLLFVDADVEVRADAIARIRSRFEADPGLTALFGSYDDSPSAPGVVSGFRNLLHHHVHQNAPGPATTFWTGLGAVRRDAFESVGGFDESVEFMEDIDLGMRLSAAGARIELDPLVQGTHLKRWSVWSMVRTDFIGRGVPWVLLLLRHRGSTTTLNLGWRHRLSALAALAGTISLLRRHFLGAAGSALALVALNRSFYSLLWRRRGPAEATTGVFLHALHHLASLAAVPVGVALHLLDRSRPRR
jgi:GT2 family glycosyltransferase